MREDRSRAAGAGAGWPRLRVSTVGPFAVGALLWRGTRGERMCTIIAKVTYPIQPDTTQPLAAPLGLQEHDGHWDDDPAKSLHLPGDLAPFKQAAEVVVVGSAFAPAGPALRVTPCFIVGNVNKGVEAWVPRRFASDGAILDSPAQARFSLRYEHAAGGPETDNPAGIDVAKYDLWGRRGIPGLLPLGHNLGAPGSFIPTVGFGPIAADWRPRQALLSDADRAWLRRPLEGPLPASFPARFYQTAPPDQWLDRPFAANERIVLEGLHPKRARLALSLGGAEPYAVVPRGPRDPIRLRGDLLVIDTERELLTLTFRGHFELPPDVEQLRIIIGDGPTPERESLGSAPDGQTVTGAPQSAGGWRGRESEPEEEELDAEDVLEVTSAHLEQTSAQESLKSGSTLPFRREAAWADAAAQYAGPASATQAEPAPPKSVPSPAMRAPEPPMRAPAPPMRAPEPPASTPEPAMVRRPPLVPAPAPAPEPPMRMAEPPMRAPEPPMRMAEPPMRMAEPPMRAPEPPMRAPEPLMRMSEPPAPAPALPGRSLLLGGALSASAEAPPAAPPAQRVRPLVPALSAEPAATSDSAPLQPAPLGSVRALSDAAAGPEQGLAARPFGARPPKTPPGPAGAERLAIVDLLGFDAKAAARLRWTRRFADLLAKKDQPRPLGSTTEARPEAPDRERADVLRVLSFGSPADLPEIRAALAEGLNDVSDLEPPLLLVAGDLTPSFDEVETLASAVAIAQSVAAGDKKVLAAVAVGQEALGTPVAHRPDALVNFYRQVEQACATLALPPRYLASQVERVLIEGRKYKRRTLFGAPRVRATLALSRSAGEAMPCYLPETMTASLPLLPSYPVIALCEARPREDISESHPQALLVLALGRVLYSRER